MPLFILLVKWVDRTLLGVRSAAIVLTCTSSGGAKISSPGAEALGNVQQ